MDAAKSLVKKYRLWLDNHCDLYDWTTTLWRQPNSILEYFRRNPKEYRRSFDSSRIYDLQKKPTLKTFADHRELKGTDTLFISNSFTKRPFHQHLLLMLFDIDAKKGQQDATSCSQFVSSAFFNNRTYIEPSRSGKGRHGYFLLDIEFCHLSEIRPVIRELAIAIKLCVNNKFDSQFDDIFGIPTIWDGNKIEYRGNALKLPYLRNGESDFDLLKTLTPVLLSDLRDLINHNKPLVSPSLFNRNPLGSTTPFDSENDIINTNGNTNSQPKKINHNKPLVSLSLFNRNPLGSTLPLPATNGWERKCQLVSKTLHENGGQRPDLDSLYDEYMAHWYPTIENGGEQQRRNELEKIVTQMVSTFQPATTEEFDRTKYLPLVTELVPPLAFVWKRKNKINHQRLADFVLMKIQDADFGHNGRVARDTTLTRSKALHENGKVDWIVTKNTYSKLLKLATEYGLLEIYDDYTRPSYDIEDMKVVKVNGEARLIGPGAALPIEQARFLLRHGNKIPTSENREIA